MRSASPTFVLRRRRSCGHLRVQREVVRNAPLDESAWKGLQVGTDRRIPAAVLFRANLEQDIEILDAEMHGANVVNVRELCVVKYLFVVVRQIMVQCLA